MSMKIGDLIEYINIDGAVIYGVVCKTGHEHSVGTTAGRHSAAAVDVVWTDDKSITTEFVDDILDPDYVGMALL